MKLQKCLCTRANPESDKRRLLAHLSIIYMLMLSYSPLISTHPNHPVLIYGFFNEHSHQRKFTRGHAPDLII